VRYAVELSHRAAKTLQRLDQTTKKRLQARVDELALDPLSSNLSKPLIMVAGQRYSRVGDWRIIYEVEEFSAKMYIVTIQPRGKAYRNL
jgi:mRNA interferase RelE/StbE